MRKKVILLSGKLQSGKNATSDFIFEWLANNNKSYKHLFFAKPLKDACAEDFKLVENYLNEFVVKFVSDFGIAIGRDGIKRLSELMICNENYYENKTELTRRLLQLYGTEIFRQRVDTDYWVNKTLNDIKRSSEEYYVITDLRFPNELLAPKKDHDIDTYALRINRDFKRENEHYSETALDNYPEWDLIINNTGTLDDLKILAFEFMKKVNNGNN